MLDFLLSKERKVLPNCHFDAQQVILFQKETRSMIGNKSLLEVSCYQRNLRTSSKTTSLPPKAYQHGVINKKRNNIWKHIKQPFFPDNSNNWNNKHTIKHTVISKSFIWVENKEIQELNVKRKWGTLPCNREESIEHFKH